MPASNASRFSIVLTVGLILALSALLGFDREPTKDDFAWAVTLRQTAEGLATDHAKPVLRPEALRGLEKLDERIAVYRRFAAQVQRQPSSDSEAYEVFSFGGEEALPVMVEILRDPDPVRGCHGADFVQAVDSDASLDLLIEAATHHPAVEVRREAMMFLGWSRNPRAMATFRTALGNSDPRTVEQAVIGLGILRDGESFDAIAAYLQNEDGEGLDLFWVARAILQIDPERALLVYDAALPKAKNEAQRQQLERYRDLDPATVGDWQPLSPVQLAARRVARSAETIARESFGAKEYDTLLAHLHDPVATVRHDCIRALGEMRYEPAVADLIAESKQRPYQETYTALIRIGTPEAVGFVGGRARRGGVDERRQVALGLGLAGRAGAAMLVRLLDDPGLRREPTPPHWIFGDGAGNIMLPAGHYAFDALSTALRDGAATWRWHNLAKGAFVHKSGEGFDINREIAKFRQWWSEHGQAFLRGEPVPPFEFIHFMYST